VQPPGPQPPYPPQGPFPPYPPPPGAFNPPPIGGYGYPPPAAPQPSGEAIAALVCGLLAFSCFPLGFVAIWLGARARAAARENPDRVGGEQMALIGMIVGGVLGTLYLLFVIVYVVIIVFAIGFSALKP
jgi:hypothetical protein